MNTCIELKVTKPDNIVGYYTKSYESDLGVFAVTFNFGIRFAGIPIQIDTSQSYVDLALNTILLKCERVEPLTKHELVLLETWTNGQK